MAERPADPVVRILDPEETLQSVQEPATPSHLVRQKCPKGFMAWDESRIIYSIDHRAFLVFCTKCDGYHTKPAGSPVMMKEPTTAADQLVAAGKKR